MQTTRLYGVDFPVASDIEKFCEIIADKGRCIMLIDIKDYAQVWQAVFNYCDKKFGKGSRFMYGVTSSYLICSGCGLMFPDSYTQSLRGWFDDDEVVIGATPGFREFGKAAKCLKCSSVQAHFAYDNLPAEEITQKDVEYIRKYWYHLATKWWKKESRTQAACDICGSPVSRDYGYLQKSNLLCEPCCDKHLGSDALEKLRKNPNHFGKWEIRKARYFITSIEMMEKIRSLAGLPTDWMKSIQESAKGYEDEEIARILEAYFWALGDIKTSEELVEHGKDAEVARNLIFSKIKEISKLVFEYRGKSNLSNIYNRFNELISPWIDAEKKIQAQRGQMPTGDDFVKLISMQIAVRAEPYIVDIRNIMLELLNK